MDDYSSKGFWLATYGPYQATPALLGDHKVDVAVVGGGFTGMAAAYFLKKEQPSLRVAVLESEAVGYGASGRWGGPVSVNLDFAPNIGYVGKDKRVVFSVGCMGHAVSMTHLNGWTVADLILERETERTDVFFVNRSSILTPGEPILTPVVGAVLGYMRAEDAIYERKGLGR